MGYGGGVTWGGGWRPPAPPSTPHSPSPPQEIASYLITFEKHDEWLSCTPKTRSGEGGGGGAPRPLPTLQPPPQLTY